MRVLVALSGGVDSSVAAARLIDDGHDVTGVHLALSREAKAAPGSRGCCTLDDARDARRVADRLGIPFYVWDLSELFAREVMDDFLDEYRAGRTPNPCLRCNETIKFAAVLDRALALDFDAVATGHYARIVPGSHGPELHRAADLVKDQSYVLGVLDAGQIACTLLPLGDATAKEDVRAEAAARGLLTAAKPDSHDICFIPDGDTARFLRSRLGESEGEFIDAESGRALGRHQGAFAYTIGQRRGLDIKVPAGDGSPRYVIDVEISTGSVFVGSVGALDVRRITASRLRWAGPELAAGSTRVHAQVRAHGTPLAGEASALDGTLTVHLDEPVQGLAPGQAVVLYDGTRVIGSATVDSTDALERARGQRHA